MIYYFLTDSDLNPSSEKKTLSELSYFSDIPTKKIRVKNCFLVAFHQQPEPKILKKIAHLSASYHYSPIANLCFNQQILNIPRFGTQSPFSSKAFDILAISGIEIKQIEQANLWQFNHSQFIEAKKNQAIKRKIEHCISDPMTHQVLWDNQIASFFKTAKAKSFKQIEVLNQKSNELMALNQQIGLGLSQIDINYLSCAYEQMQRNPTDVELMMFAVVNSEHCRHKIFNAKFVIDNRTQELSLFEMIRHTSKISPNQLITAYSDNSAIIKGNQVDYFYRNQKGHFSVKQQNQGLLMKVETHNHPTVISPYAGAATGSGGEIRDEGATGRGARSTAGLTGFSVSNLHLPDYPQVWEKMADYQPNYPEKKATSLEIMIDGPIGGANFNNEFGRANLAGYFRSFEYLDSNQKRWGFHKPIMIAGGMGEIIQPNFKKKKLEAGVLIIVLGEAALKIGIGGGSASSSSLNSEKNSELDFSSVQRDNPEAQRRCQEVINHCIDLIEDNPILSIHDVGAGGLSNAIPELINDNDLGATLDFNQIAINDKSMNPLEIWCNESQERYVLAIDEQSLDRFKQICKKERCPFQLLGQANSSKQLVLQDKVFNNQPVDLHLDWLFAKPTPLVIKDHSVAKPIDSLDQTKNLIEFEKLNLSESIKNVLNHPSVGSKAFLIHIADKSVGGKVVQDQMLGSYQIPIADCAICFDDFENNSGSAMSMGERPALAIIDSKASAKIAATEAILNLAGSDIDFGKIALSANWMADCSDQENFDANNHENAKLFDAVKALSIDFCPPLSVAIPVGKDSLSMKMSWQKEGVNHQVTAPVSLNISAFAKVRDVHKTLSAELKNPNQDSYLIRVQIAKQQAKEQSLTSSIFLQTHNLLAVDQTSIDIEASELKAFLDAFQSAKQSHSILAYHDISDGGMLATICEMQFTTRQSIKINLQAINQKQLYHQLFNESPAVIVQVSSNQLDDVVDLFNQAGLKAQKIAQVISKTNCKEQKFEIYNCNQLIYQSSRANLEKQWARVSYEIKKIRDNPKLVKQEFEAISGNKNELFIDVSSDLSTGSESTGSEKIANLKTINAIKNKPKVAVLREQGINGHYEMAFAFYKAGFEVQDVHMSELIDNQVNLKKFDGLAFPGGFSYGDTFGAATGWASSILYNQKLANDFAEFFNQKNTFALGLCNGCQVLSKLKTLIPGADYWPSFKHNLSSRFEARQVMVEVLDSPSLFLQGMKNSFIPIVVSHGEGRATFEKDDYQQAQKHSILSLRYVNFDKTIATDYPMNPNGSLDGVAGLTNQDGRFTIMMPHPERTLRLVQLAFADKYQKDNSNKISPWFKIFQNARKSLN